MRSAGTLEQAAAPRRGRQAARWRRRVAAAVLGLVLGTTLAELGARVIAPLETETRALALHRRVAIEDRYRSYRLRSDVEADWSAFSEHDPRSVPFRTNAEGRRARDFDSGGSGRELLVACLGDSTTMGFGVGDEAHYPFLLGEVLAQRHPERRVRVLNFGTHGYTSEQGLVQLEREVLSLQPAILTFAFGYNDATLSPLDERSARARVPPAAWMPVHEALYEKSAAYHALWEAAFPLGSLPREMPRVGRAEFEAHLRAMIAHARAISAEPVLIDSCVPHSHLREVSRALAAELGVAHLCLRELFEAEARAAGSDPLAERTLGSRGIRQLRVRWRGAQEPQLVIFDLADARRWPQVLSLRDDGREGDETADDGVFSIAAPLMPHAVRLDWMVCERAPLRAHPDALFHQFYRLLELDHGTGFETPVLDREAWLRGIGQYLRTYVGDYGHPNELGHRAIARAVAELLAPPR